MTAMEQIIKNYCPADQGMETEMSIECRYEEMSKAELFACGECEKCWESEVEG